VSLGWGIVLALVAENAVFGEWVDELVTIAAEQGFPNWGAQGTIFRGWIKVKNGDVAEGISLLCNCSAAYRANGAQLWMPRFIALLARAFEIAAQVDEAVTLLDDALQIVERTGERWFAAELNRHKGQLLAAARAFRGRRGTLSPSPEHCPGAGG
jgi:predicted ATPase